MKKSSVVTYMLSSTLVVVLLWAAGLVVILGQFADSGLGEVNNSVGDSALSIDKLPEETYSTTQQPLPEPTGDAENYLLVGVDSRQGANGDVGAGDSSAVTGTRTDTIMVAHLSGDKQKMTITSIPRDLGVTNPGCEQWDSDTGTYGEPMEPEDNVKINSVYSTGGPRCLVRVLTNLTGLKFTRFAGIDFAGFEGIVNSVGGVDMCSEKYLEDKQLGHIMDSGTHNLTGNQALNFVRARKIIGENQSDYERIERQQYFLASLMNKVMSSGTLSNPQKSVALVRSVVDATFGENIDSNHIMELMKTANSMDRNNIVFTTIPTLGSDDQYNEIPDMEGINNLFSSMVSDGDESNIQESETQSNKTDTVKPTGTATTSESVAPTSQPENSVPEKSVVVGDKLCG